MNKSYTLFVSFIVALGGFLLGFDSAVISGAVSGIRTYFEMSDWELGFSVGQYGKKWIVCQVGSRYFILEIGPG